MKYKGAMTRASGANTDLQEARNPSQRPAPSGTMAQSA
jgi:hypothetical protein